MATGSEMMMEQGLKLLAKVFKLDPDVLTKQINDIHATIATIGTVGATALGLLLMANRRLHQIQTHLGLSDIEPIPPEMKVINHVEVSSSVVIVPDAAGT